MKEKDLLDILFITFLMIAGFFTIVANVLELVEIIGVNK